MNQGFRFYILYDLRIWQNLEMEVFLLKGDGGRVGLLSNSAWDHWQTFVMLCGFWPLKGLEGLGESVKKIKFLMKTFFQKMLNEFLKSVKKDIVTDDVKADVKALRDKCTGVVSFFI